MYGQCDQWWFNLSSILLNNYNLHVLQDFSRVVFEVFSLNLLNYQVQLLFLLLFSYSVRAEIQIIKINFLWGLNYKSNKLVDPCPDEKPLLIINKWHHQVSKHNNHPMSKYRIFPWRYWSKVALLGKYMKFSGKIQRKIFPTIFPPHFTTTYTHRQNLVHQ